MRAFALTFGFFLTMNLYAQKADLVLMDATVYTVDEKMSVAEAIAVKGSRILAVGTNAEIETYIDEETQTVDLDGKTMIPGFIDSHYHFMGVGRREFYLNLDGTKSLDEFLEKTRVYVSQKSKGEWVTGRGWIEEDWPTKRFPSRHDLDEVAPENPVMLRRADGHAAVVNTMALDIAGITRETEAPDGGEILRDDAGAPTGMLIDKAMKLVSDHMPKDDAPERMRQYALKAQESAFAYGITQVHDMGTYWKTVDVWKKLFDDGDLKIRIYAYIRWPDKEDANLSSPGPGDAGQLLQEGAQIGLYEDRLTIRGIKVSQDGALGSRGAALLQKYEDEATMGLLMYEDELLLPIIRKALQADIQMAIHAIGDRANRDVLDLYEQAFQEISLNDRDHVSPRFRIEHAQIVSPEDIPRFAELGVIPSMQPSHAIGDLHFAVRRLGLDRMEGAYAWRTFIDNGGFIPAGSDAPVEEGNPMIEFYAAVARKDTSGFSTDGWHPELKMTREEALKSLTIWGSKAVFEENIKGSIEPGKLADLVVLQRDLMTEPEERLFDIKVLMTLIGGEIVFDRDGDLTSKLTM